MAEHRHSTAHEHKKQTAWHKDWRTWVVVGLMLVAMLVYVFSVDESVGPGADETNTETPAAM